jgi:hypothetical protein
MQLRPLTGLAIALAIVVATSTLALAGPAPKRTFTLELTAQQAWRAEALGAALTADLTDDRLEPAHGGAPDLVIHATIEDERIRYELVPTWQGAPPPVTGSIAAGRDRIAVAGQLRDQLHRLARATEAPETAREVEMPAVAALLLVAGLLAAILLLPFALRLRDPAVRALPALRRTIVTVAIAGIALVALGAAGDVLPNVVGVLFAAGGIAWGLLVTALFPLVFTPLVGLSRVEHEELPRVLRLWVGSVLLRALSVTLFFGPVAVATWLVCQVLDVDDAVALVLVVPVALLAARQVVRITAAVLAVGLDKRLTGITGDVEAWDSAVRAYFVGYLRRNGLPVDTELLARVKFLPGATDEALVYGGGLAPSRIVIPRRLLVLALAPWGRPHDYAAKRVSTLHWLNWNAGLVMATEPGTPLATADQRKPRESDELGESERQLFGEPPTLAGIVEPVQLDPRTHSRPADDPMWLEWDSGEEYDGTDAGDKDFLFGLIVHALAMIERHRDRLTTLRLAVTQPRLGKPLARVHRMLERGTSSLADAHASLGGARHHLVQYLAWRLWQREDLLTARAYAPELEAASRRVLHLLTESEARDPDLGYRLTRLGLHVRGAPPAPVRRWQRLIVAGALVAGASIAVIAVVNAVRYHATYAQRLESSHGQGK